MGIYNAVKVLVGSLYTPRDMAINIENTLWSICLLIHYEHGLF